jgi:hypothetical protein
MLNTLEGAVRLEKDAGNQGKHVNAVIRETQDCSANRLKKQIHLSNE